MHLDIIYIILSLKFEIYYIGILFWDKISVFTSRIQIHQLTLEYLYRVKYLFLAKNSEFLESLKKNWGLSFVQI